MQTCTTTEPTSTDAVINNLLVTGVQINQPRLSVRAKKLLGGSYLRDKNIFENDTSSWIDILKLAVDFNVPYSIIQGMLSPNAYCDDADKVCCSLLGAIKAEMGKFKAKIQAQYPLSDSSLKYIDSYGGDLKISNELSELNSKPYLVLHQDWLVPLGIYVNKLPDSEIRYIVGSLVESLSCEGYFLSSTDLIYDHHLYSMFYEMFPNDKHKLLKGLEVENWEDEEAVEFVKDTVSNEEICQFLAEYEFESLHDIDVKTCLGLTVELVETQSYSRKLRLVKSEISRLNENCEISRKLKSLLPLLKKIRPKSMTAIDDNIEGTHTFCFTRTVSTGGMSSYIIDESAQYLMETGENGVLAFSTQSKKELLKTLQQYYLINYITVALSEIIE